MKLEQLVEEVGSLMPAPQILPQLLALLNDMDSDPFDIVELIRVDAQLTAQVLKLSNSAFYGMSSPSSSLEEAVNRIGFEEVYKLVAVICSSDLLDSDLAAYCIEPGKMWEHSLATAVIMELMAKELDYPESTAYTIGLLHCIGKTLINQAMSDDYFQVFEKVEKEGMSLVRAESAVLGFNHAQVGAELLKKWKFSLEIYEPIEFQFKPLNAPTEKDSACQIHLANGIAADIGMSAGRDAFALELDSLAANRLKLSAEDFQRYLLVAHEQMAEIKKLLEVTRNKEEA